MTNSSEWQAPAAVTLSKISDALGVGFSISTSSGREPMVRYCSAFTGCFSLCGAAPARTLPVRDGPRCTTGVVLLRRYTRATALAEPRRRGLRWPREAAGGRGGRHTRCAFLSGATPGHADRPRQRSQAGDRASRGRGPDRRTSRPAPPHAPDTTRGSRVPPVARRGRPPRTPTPCRRPRRRATRDPAAGPPDAVAPRLATPCSPRRMDGARSGGRDDRARRAIAGPRARRSLAPELVRTLPRAPPTTARCSPPSSAATRPYEAGAEARHARPSLRIVHHVPVTQGRARPTRASCVWARSADVARLLD